MKERKNIIQMRMEYYMLINLFPLEVRNITWGYERTLSDRNDSSDYVGFKNETD